MTRVFRLTRYSKKKVAREKIIHCIHWLTCLLCGELLMTTLGSIKTDRDDSPAFKSVNFLFRRANIIIYIYIAYMSYILNFNMSRTCKSSNAQKRRDLCLHERCSSLVSYPERESLGTETSLVHRCRTSRIVGGSLNTCSVYKSRPATA